MYQTQKSNNGHCVTGFNEVTRCVGGQFRSEEGTEREEEGTEREEEGTEREEELDESHFANKDREEEAVNVSLIVVPLLIL